MRAGGFRHFSDKPITVLRTVHLATAKKVSFYYAELLFSRNFENLSKRGTFSRYFITGKRLLSPTRCEKYCRYGKRPERQGSEIAGNRMK